MLFALWTENRATEDSEGTSTSIHSRHSGSVHSVSRQASIIMPVTVARLGDAIDDTAIEKEKEFVKDKVVDEAQGGVTAFEDQRPAVFKSTFWEILCVASLVSVQLANVRSQLNDSNIRNWHIHNKLLSLL
jgi:hypothetical protein